MTTWDDAITIMQKGAKASDTDATSYLKTMANVGYKLVLASLERSVTERTKTALTVANQQGYQFPSEALFVKTVSITVGGMTYTPVEERDQTKWNKLNSTQNQTSTIPSVFFIKERLGVGGGEVLFWPKPSASGNTITMVYEASDRDMAQTAYTTGTSTFTTNSAAVAATGSAFTQSMAGRYIRSDEALSDGLWYRINSVIGNTSIILENVYEGPTVTGTYRISEAFNLPEDMQILPCYYSLWHWFLTKQDKDQVTIYRGLFLDGMSSAMKRWGTKTRDGSIYDIPYGDGDSPYPFFFPTNIT